MKVELECIAMAGNQYVLTLQGGAPAFPRGELRPGEPPADAMRRIVKEATGTDAPKLEVVELRAGKQDALQIVFRALLVGEPQGEHKRVARMELPERVGTFTGREVEEMLKTGLNYKLTRV